MITETHNGLEAQKLIDISLGKIAQSRCGRSGASLHKSLLVASVLHKARFVYLEAIYCPQHSSQPEDFCPEPPRAPTPLPEVTVTPVIPLDCTEISESCDEYSEDELSADECSERLCGSDSDDDFLVTPNRRKRRRVSDQETEAAVSSILPKRKRADVESENCSDCYYAEQSYVYETEILCSSCGYSPAACRCNQSPPSHAEEVCSMEVDHITSLVSIFSFNQQQQADLCASQIPHHQDSGPPVVALTA